jgi:Sulfotransferase family
MQAATTLQLSRSPLPVRLVNRLGRMLEDSSLPLIRPTARDLIRAAKRRCRLQDFGDGAFFEPLSRLLEACRQEAHLNFIGNLVLRSDLVRILSNRLLLQRDRQSNPDISRQEIRQPLFIVGLPRSGTTILHTLLAADPAHQAPLTWEVIFPTLEGRDDRTRIRQVERSLAALQWLAPTFRQVHAVGAELPQECVGLLGLSLLSDQFDTMYRVPSYRSWFLKQDMLPAYQWHWKFLQHLQHRHGSRRWILKAPVHMFALRTLLSIYPDAIFVQAHRDPAQAITSVSSLIAILRSIFSDRVDPVETGRDALQYWATTMAAFLEERDRLPAGRIYDLDYREVRRDPIAAVQQVYAYFGWEFSSQAEQRMRAVLAEQPREQNGFHRYEASQFGLDVDEIRERFSSYDRRFGLSAEMAPKNEANVSASPETLCERRV